nr:MAG TPA: hypothetical protein [Caudoviricetes sp.]
MLNHLVYALIFLCCLNIFFIGSLSDILSRYFLSRADDTGSSKFYTSAFYLSMVLS